MEELNTAIEALQRARDAKLAELQSIEQALGALGVSLAGGPTQRRGERKDFEDLGVTAAAKRFLREKAPEPQDTRTIADALLNRGLQTNSKNFIATVYATLNNSSAIQRKDGRWELREPDE